MASRGEDDVAGAVGILLIVALAVIAFGLWKGWKGLDLADLFSRLIAWLHDIVENFSVAGWKAIDSITPAPNLPGVASNHGQDMEGRSDFDIVGGTEIGQETDGDGDADANPKEEQ